jgi:hypothetical protein
MCFLVDSISTETAKLQAELDNSMPKLPNLVSNNFSYVREEVSRYRYGTICTKEVE